MAQDDIGALFSQILVDDYEDDIPWRAVHDLRSIGTTEIFDQATVWCKSANSLHRARGADVLAKIGWNAAPAIAKVYRDKAFGIMKVRCYFDRPRPHRLAMGSLHLLLRAANIKRKAQRTIHLLVKKAVC
jgi:hypothetical protein